MRNVRRSDVTANSQQGRFPTARTIRSFGRFVVLVLLLIWAVGCAGFFNRPAIKEGEFPFSLTYSRDGVDHLIEDSVVCRYRGKKLTGGGASENWDLSLASGNEYVVLKALNESQVIFFPTGACNWYMGTAPSTIPNGSLASLLTTYRNGYRPSSIDPAELANVHGIVIKDFSPSPPISQPPEYSFHRTE